MKTYILIVCLIFPVWIFAQNPFNFTFGESGADGSTGISLIGDSLIMSNTISNYKGITYGFSILYLNQFGDSIFPTVINSSNMNWTAKFVSNNGILASTGRYYVNSTDLDMALTVINNGIINTYHYGGQDIELGYDFEILPDSGFLIVGTTKSFGAGGYDVYIVRTDKNGDSLWTRTYGDNEGQFANGIERESDSVYVVAGKWGNLNNNSMDAFAMRINLQGDTLAFKLYGNHLQNFGQSLCKTNDGGYTIAGWSTYDYGGYYSPDAVLYKLDSNLNLLWTKYYGTLGTEDIFDVKQTYDNGFVLVGHSSVANKGEDVYIIRTDSIGDTLWTRTLGGAYNDRAYSVVQTPDSGFAIVGNTYSYGAGGSDAFFLKLKPSGETTVSIGLQPKLKDLEIRLYPNPARENITLDITNTLNQESELFIYNAWGQMIRSYKMQQQQSEISISLIGIKSGVYYCELRTNNKTIGTGKFVKE